MPKWFSEPVLTLAFNRGWTQMDTVPNRKMREIREPDFRIYFSLSCRAIAF